MTMIRIGYSAASPKVGPIHAELLRRANSGREIAAIPMQMGGAHGQPGPPHSMDDLDAILVDGGADNSPETIIQALSTGLHVLVDGMPGQSVEDIIEIRRAEANARTSKLKLNLGYRDHDSVKAANAYRSNESLGELISIRAILGVANQQDGALLRHGASMLDLLHMFTGPIEQVQSLIDAPNHALPVKDRNVMAILRNHAGVMANLHISTTQWRETFRIEAGFTKGYIWLDGILTNHADFGPEMLIIGTTERDASGQPLPNPDEQITEFKNNPAPARCLEDFLDAIRTGRAIHTGNSMQAFDAMSMVHRIYAADQQFQFT